MKETLNDAGEIQPPVLVFGEPNEYPVVVVPYKWIDKPLAEVWQRLLDDPDAEL